MPMSDDISTDSPPRIDVKEAIRAAKTEVAELLEGEAYQALGLEEVKYDERDNVWLITLGWNRPWDVEKRHSQASGLSATIAGIVPTTTTRQLRTFKKIKIDGKTGAFISMED
jgi:hypothetical protein